MGDVRQDGLERDPLVQLEILGLVELAHAAFREVADDAEAEGDDVTGPKDGGPRRPSLDRWGDGRLVIVRSLRRGRRRCLDLATEQALNREMGIDPRDHLFRLDGLRDEIHRARFEASYSVLRVVECRQEDHGRVACVRVLFEAAARLVAVDARHDDVEQDERWSCAAGDLQRLFATAGHEQTVVRARERFAQDVQICGFVIDQENPAGPLRRAWCEWIVIIAV